MTQQLFEDLAASPPPSTIDVPGIVRREKRRRLVIRAGVPAAAVLAVAGGVAVLSPAHPATPAVRGTSTAAAGPGAAAAGPRTAMSGPGTATGPGTAATPAAGFRLVANDQTTATATAARLRTALATAVRRAAPGTTWLAQGLTKAPTPDGQPPRIVGDDLTRPTDQMFTGTTGIALAGRRGTLSLNIISINPCTGGALAKCPTEHSDPAALRREMAKGLYACQPAAQKCSATTSADGRRRRVQTTLSLGGFVSQETTVELADGRALMLTVDNQFIAPGSTSNHDDVAQSAPPLSPAQVTTTATTIGDQILS